MQLEWSPALSVGHDEIDRQHQELFAAFEAFIDGCVASSARETLQELHTYLEEYVDKHFREEESLMAETGYPGLPEHRQEHRAFRSRLAELRAELAGEGLMLHVLVATNKTLVSWLLHHVQEVDQQFGLYLKNNAS